MRKFTLLKSMLLTAILLVSGNVWAQERATLFSFTGTSGYANPPAEGWTTEGTTAGGSYFKLDKGSTTSPLYAPHNNVSFAYSVATFGSGTNHPLKVEVLDNAGVVKNTYESKVPTESKTYADGSIDLGNITHEFRLRLSGETGKGVRLRNFVLTADLPAAAVETPVFSIPEGNYGTAQSVTITCATAGAAIYYTINGNEPTKVSTPYNNQAIEITATTTLKAIAYVGDDASYVATATYRIYPATPALPYTEDFAADLGAWYAHSLSGDQTWKQESKGGKTYAVINGYSDKAINEDWLISPKLVSATDGVILTFATATGYAGAPLALKYSTDYSGFGDPSTATWTDITGQAQWANIEGDYFTWTESGNISIEQQEVYVAFVYTCAADKAATWQVTDIRVTEIPNTPMINVTENALDFGKINAGTTKSLTFSLSATNLNGNATLSIAGEGFSVAPESVTPADGKIEATEVTVTFAPAAVQAYNATLTVKSEGAADAVIALSGNATLEAPVAGEATDATHNSFVAHWTPVDFADGYTVTVSAGIKGSENNPYSVDEFLAADIAEGTEVYVHGYAAGTVKSTGKAYDTTPGGDTNLALAAAPGADHAFIPVELPKDGNLRETWGLKTNSDKLDSHITVCAVKETYFNNPNSLKGTSAITEYTPSGASYQAEGGETASLRISDLNPETEYFYTVTAKAGNVVSAASNAMAVTTTADPGEDTGLATLEAGSLYVADGLIHFNATAGTPVTLYNVTGQAIYNGFAAEGTNNIAAPAGIVLVKVGETTAKVVVK